MVHQFASSMPETSSELPSGGEENASHRVHCDAKRPTPHKQLVDMASPADGPRKNPSGIPEATLDQSQNNEKGDATPSSSSCKDVADHTHQPQHTSAEAQEFTKQHPGLLPDDIMIGHVKDRLNHKGNIAYNSLILENSEDYQNATTGFERKIIAKSVMKHMAANKNRLMEYDSTANVWKPIEDVRAIQSKVTQSLRRARPKKVGNAAKEDAALKEAEQTLPHRVERRLSQQEGHGSSPYVDDRSWSWSHHLRQPYYLHHPYHYQGHHPDGHDHPPPNHSYYYSRRGKHYSRPPPPPPPPKGKCYPEPNPDGEGLPPDPDDGEEPPPPPPPLPPPRQQHEAPRPGPAHNYHCSFPPGATYCQTTHGDRSFASTYARETKDQPKKTDFVPTSKAESLSPQEVDDQDSSSSHGPCDEPKKNPKRRREGSFETTGPDVEKEHGHRVKAKKLRRIHRRQLVKDQIAQGPRTTDAQEGLKCDNADVIDNRRVARGVNASGSHPREEEESLHFHAEVDNGGNGTRHERWDAGSEKRSCTTSRVSGIKRAMAEDDERQSDETNNMVVAPVPERGTKGKETDSDATSSLLQVSQSQELPQEQRVPNVAARDFSCLVSHAVHVESYLRLLATAPVNQEYSPLQKHLRVNAHQTQPILQQMVGPLPQLSSPSIQKTDLHLPGTPSVVGLATSLEGFAALAKQGYIHVLGKNATVERAFLQFLCDNEICLPLL